MRLREQVALVTGASRGIGRAIARALVEEGASLLLVSQREEPLEEARRELSRAGVRVEGLAGDVADEGFVARAFDHAERRLGPLDVLVNNAGVLEMAPVAELTRAQFERTLEVNLVGAFLCAREAVRRMVPRGRGRIISVTSISATLGTPRLSAYCASKWGLQGFVKSLAEELRGTGVLSMGVAPGSVDTDMLRRSGFEPAMKPDDVAVAVRFLASEAPAAMQGSVLELFG
jgi:NAD(P)-dependent dehydrogenase (short-subunit alcohol dehydrogenase family)